MLERIIFNRLVEYTEGTNGFQATSAAYERANLHVYAGPTVIVTVEVGAF